MKQLFKVWKYSSDMTMLSRIVIFGVYFIGVIILKFVLCNIGNLSISSLEIIDISFASIIPYIIWGSFLVKMGKDLKKERGTFIFLGSITKKSYLICQNIILLIYEILFFQSVIVSSKVGTGKACSTTLLQVVYGIFLSIIIMHFIILPARLVSKSLFNKKIIQIVMGIIIVLVEFIAIAFFETICEIVFPLFYLNIEIDSGLYSFDILSGLVIIILYLVFNIFSFKIYDNKLEIK